MCCVPKAAVQNMPKNPDNVFNSCQAACTNMRVMKCDGWQGSPGEDEIFGTEDDVPCYEACTIMEMNPEADLEPDCIAFSESCNEVKKCYD